MSDANVNAEKAKEEAATLLMAAQAVSVARGDFEISSEEEFTEVGNALREIQGRIKTVEARRKEWVDPLNKTVRSINGFFKPVVTEWESVVTCLKKAMAAYQQRKQEESRKALEEAAKIAAAGNATGMTEDAQQYQALVAKGSALPPKADGITTRENWKFRITDASLVPREYLSVDEKKVGAAVKLSKGDTKIPGIEVYREDTVVVRSA